MKKEKRNRTCGTKKKALCFESARYTQISCRFFMLIIVMFFILPSVFAQQAARPWWLSLEQGKVKFRSGEYGAALMLFEDARRDRRAMYEQMERNFIEFLSVNEVRRIGDRLDHV